MLTLFAVALALRRLSGGYMSTRPWWLHALEKGLWLAAMSLMMGWLARSRQRPRTAHQPDVLEYPRSVLLVGVACSGLFLAVAVLSWLFPGKDGSPLISLLFLGFALLGVELIAEYVRVRHHLEPGGLRYQTVLGKRGVLLWANVTRVRYSASAKWFRLDGTSGEVIRISAMLTSLSEFARALLEGVPRERIEPDTVGVLEATAAGSPPSLWQ